MGMTGAALERSVRLQEEVPVAGLRDATVNYRAVFRIGGAVGVGGSAWIEPGMLALTENDDSDMG